MPPSNAARPFWKTKTLREMSREEWESLCDGCGKCCLHKLQFEETGEVHYTDIACRLLDMKSCRCSNYEERTRLVPDCIKLRPENLMQLNWLPSTCAYRLLANGKDLPFWHPLVSGSKESVHRANQSIRGKAQPERKGQVLEHHIVTWPA